MAKTILAVAIGESTVKTTISGGPPPPGVRPYILGLIDGLGSRGLQAGAGADYVIDYNECKASQLAHLFAQAPAVDAVFCMSTRVVDQASAHFRDPSIPIVGIVSDYSQYTAGNVCGYSAKRFQSALDLYNHFKSTVPGLGAVYVLHQPGYNPSSQAYNRINGSLGASAGALPFVDVTEGNDIKTALDNARIPRGAGLLVLPIDRCFGAAKIILQWSATNSIPTFWPVTDWVTSTVPGALGGYGVSQRLCGEYMAKKLATFWSTGMPAQRFDDCDPSDIAWVASREVAQGLGVTLGSPPGLHFV
jgi:hypothetical protein